MTRLLGWRAARKPGHKQRPAYLVPGRGTAGPVLNVVLQPDKTCDAGVGPRQLQDTGQLLRAADGQTSWWVGLH